MSIISYRRLVILLVAAIVVLVGGICDLAQRRNREQQEIKVAWSVVADYERSRNGLSKMGVDDDAALLQVIVGASTNVRNRQLNMIMEREKSRVIHDIIDDLRKKTGEDLGDKPEKWINKYHHQRN